jgi:hypothetical protein
VTWRPADVRWLLCGRERPISALSSPYMDGFPGEWHRHHQGGLTGYGGREVFGMPHEPTRTPPSAAVAWSPSITGGAKSEDTALLTADGPEVATRTPELADVEVQGLYRPGITLV